ncbi:hypothetical protein [Hymenobacter glacieicola]|uniref:Uncharacterized protein n=1 Tax=Hymenobacter glacieicola TaxID=1562124 RepID=A0ABQ1X6X1_9BACT|nr:hypothetical protein [Hymenobacter glacieicola]GGG60769.1 hypothetical protein GCM10011378_41000 [Hymenobacter glacieicola]
MKKILLGPVKLVPTIPFPQVNQGAPIFAKKDGRLAGMLVQEDGRWILRIGGSFGAYGYYTSLRAVIETGEREGYEFFQDIE